jgi:HPt (histidine-containing phosphotransfer) domain-containing protein
MGDQGRVRPIYSTRAEEPDLVDAIEAFAVGVAERIDHLQDAERQGDLAALARLAGSLADAADAVGYESFAQVARAVEAASRAEKPDDARAQLLELTNLAQRVRLGHPGAF